MNIGGPIPSMPDLRHWTYRGREVRVDESRTRWVEFQFDADLLYRMDMSGDHTLGEKFRGWTDAQAENPYLMPVPRDVQEWLLGYWDEIEAPWLERVVLGDGSKPFCWCGLTKRLYAGPFVLWAGVEPLSRVDVIVQSAGPPTSYPAPDIAPPGYSVRIPDLVMRERFGSRKSQPEEVFKVFCDALEAAERVLAQTPYRPLLTFARDVDNKPEAAMYVDVVRLCHDIGPLVEVPYVPGLELHPSIHPPPGEDMSQIPSLSRAELLQAHAEICQQARDLMDAKNTDYVPGLASPAGAFGNLALCELVGHCSIEEGIATRLLDKVARLCRVAKHDPAVGSEKLEDTAQDLINYAVWIIVARRAREGKLTRITNYGLTVDGDMTPVVEPGLPTP